MSQFYCRSRHLNGAEGPVFFRLLILIALGLGGFMGCATVENLNFGKPKDVPPEYRQRVGLYVHEKAEQFYTHGSGELDTADLITDHMTFHLQQVLPFNTQSFLQEIFGEVRMKEPGDKVIFKGSPLAGYFEIRIQNARYDYPDPDLARYRAWAELLVEFKTMEHEVVWSKVFEGQGTGFSDANIRLHRFGREASRALEDAFQDALYQIQDEIVKTPLLRAYFRWYHARQNPPPPPPEPPSAPSVQAQTS